MLSSRLRRDIVAAGGLMSYGPDFVDQYRQAAGYVDRRLKVRFWPLADIASCIAHVRFRG
jgi:hypothetical protein